MYAMILFTARYLTGDIVTEDICDRGTKIHGTKGELIGDMRSFVSSTSLEPMIRR